ncbi:MAG: hypothetical protein ACO38K_08840 [Ilumatobacteraceae bacterium]
MPTTFAVSDGSGAVTYAIADAGTTGCTVNSSTGELTYSSTGICTVEATAAATGSESIGTTTVAFTVETPTCAAKDSYAVGDTGPAGGTIIYEASTCQSWGWFLELAPATWSGGADSSYLPVWCDSYDVVNGAKGSRLGSGETNTATAISVCTEGAVVDASEYRGGGFVDWYLPSSGEWHQVCRWAHANTPDQGGGTLCQSSGSYTNNDGFTNHYWTSTQASASLVIENFMPFGDDFRSEGRFETNVSARPVRAFGDGQIKAGITTAVRRTTSQTLDLTVGFSTSISGLTGSDFYNAGTATGCTFSPTASSGTSIAVQVVCTGDGTIIAALEADAVTDGVIDGPRFPVHAAVVPLDSTAPTVAVAAQTLVKGTAIDGTIDERGTLYIVKSSLTPVSESDIRSAPDAEWNATGIVDAGTNRVVTNGLDDGTYTVWAIDHAGNLSAPSADSIVIRSAQSCTTDCLVGDIGPGGGTVVYDAGSLEAWGRYLEVAPAGWLGGPDSGYRPTWCDTSTGVPLASATGIGEGRANSAEIAMKCPEGAATDVREYMGNGLVDWYLATSEEWHQVCRWAHANSPSQGGGTLCQSSGSYTNNDGFDNHYWTSTQASASLAIENWMPGGNDFRSVDKLTTDIEVTARPVRAFGATEGPDALLIPSVKWATSRTIDISVHFDQAVTGLEAADFDNAGTATGCVFGSPVLATATSYTVSVTCATDGTIIGRLAADSVAAGGLTGPSSDATSSLVPVDSVPATLTLSESGSLTFVKGTAIGVALDERGTVYLVESSITVNSISDITNAADEDWNAITISTADSMTSLNTVGLATGTYRIIGLDLAENITTAGSTTVSVRDAQSCTTICVVGDTGPGGGTVVYDAGSVQPWGRYLEVAPASWSGVDDGSYRPVWCDTPASVTGADGEAIGTGASNTAAMVAGCGSGAAVDVVAYAGGGLTDWFLPSADEQREVCKFAHADYRGAELCTNSNYSYINNIGFTNHYWTSTQVSSTLAIETFMPFGNDYRTEDASTSYISARPIRAF